jgi:hypothetical protein
MLYKNAYKLIINSTSNRFINQKPNLCYFKKYVQASSIITQNSNRKFHLNSKILNEKNEQLKESINVELFKNQLLNVANENKSKTTDRTNTIIKPIIFETIIKKILTQIESDEESIIFKSLCDDSTLWKEFTTILFENINIKDKHYPSTISKGDPNKSFEQILFSSSSDANFEISKKPISIPQAKGYPDINTFLETRIIQLLFDKQRAAFRQGDFKIESIYYSLIKSYFDNLVKNDSFKYKVLELNICSLVLHYETVLLYDQTRDDTILDDLSNQLNYTIELLRKKIPEEIRENICFPLNQTIFDSIFLTKNDYRKAFEFFNKIVKSTDNRVQSSSRRLFKNACISAIINTNDLKLYENVVGKVVGLNSILYPELAVIKLSNVAMSILFRQFKSNDLEKDANLLFKSWSDIYYLPNHQVMNYLKNWLENNIKTDLNINNIFSKTIVDQK